MKLIYTTHKLNFYFLNTLKLLFMAKIFKYVVRTPWKALFNQLIVMSQRLLAFMSFLLKMKRLTLIQLITKN